MKVKVIGTGSKGNCYILEQDDRCLVLDAGMPIDKVLKAIDYDPDKIDACLITHFHKDHIMYANHYINACIPTCMSNLTTEFAGFPADSFFIHTSEELMQFDKWRILPFNVEHDAPGTRGYLISIGENTICYITDTGYVKASPKGVTGLLIECNYIREHLENSNADPVNKKRILKYHMSLERAKSYISKIDRSKLKDVLLVHYSSRHGDSERMVKEIKEVVGENVTVNMAKAGKGFIWQF